MNETFAKFIQENFGSESWPGGVEFALSPSALNLRFIDENLRRWFMKNKKREFERASLNFFQKRNFKFIYEDADAGDFIHRAEEFAPSGEPDISERLAPFLAGEKNKMAMEAARRALGADENFLSPGLPLLSFCGVAGVGKTFLLNLVYEGLLKSRPRGRIWRGDALAYLETDSASPNRSTVLLDNLHEIENSIEAQNRLTRAIDAACDGREAGFGYAFIVAFDGGSERLENFSPSLRGRLESGLIVTIEPPDLETRLKCAEKINARLGVGLSRDRLLFIARNSLRFSQINGAFRKIEFFIQTRERAPTPAEMESLLAAGALSKPLDAAAIIKKVAGVFGMKVQDIMAPSRKPRPLLARQIAMYLCRDRLGLSYPEVGRIFGGKDHSTVIHAVKKIARLKDTDKKALELLTKLENSAS